MTPSTWLTFLAFFLFVAPGLLFDLLSARKRVQRRESTFTEVSRVALVSTMCSAAAFLVVAGFAGVCAWMSWDLLPDPSAMIRQGGGYVADNFVRVVGAGAVIVILALLASWIGFRVVYRNHDSGISYTSAWQFVLRTRVPGDSGTAVHVRARLSNGTIWMGRVADYSPDHEVADRELILCPPMATKTEGGSLKAVPEKWQRVVLRGSEIASLAVTYGPSSVGARPSPLTPSAGAPASSSPPGPPSNP